MTNKSEDMDYSQQEQKEILAIANLICDFNMQKGSVGNRDRFLPYASEVAFAIYDAGYRKVESLKE